MKNISITIFALTMAGCMNLFFSCRTVQFDQTVLTEPGLPADGVASFEEEVKKDEKEFQAAMVEEELKEVDIEKSVVYVEKPVYYPIETPAAAALAGKDAVNESLKSATQIPRKYSEGLMLYDFDENFIYEIYCQPYRITDLILEPGEQVIEKPFLSESKVWEIGAGVSRKNGQDVQHFYLKPELTALTTSLIIITDRRSYHIILKSFKDTYMAMVQWEYPDIMPYTIKTDAMTAHMNSLNTATTLVDPRFLSFDYKMNYSLFKKPLWLPKRVYDDGRRTYIQLDEKVLHSKSPVLFNRKNERINYRVQQNLMVIDELIERVTLRNGSEKITIYKKNYKAPSSETTEAANEK